MYKQLLLFGVPVGFAVAFFCPIQVLGLNLCAVRFGLHINCPGCGFVRSFFSLFSGDLRRSIDMNPMGIVAAFLAVYLWLRFFILEVLFRRRATIGSPEMVSVLGTIFVIGLFVHWFIYLGIQLYLHVAGG